MRKRLTLHFLLYLLFNLSLALIIHRDILFNTHNFGRHWDWNLYSMPQLYENYFRTFLYAIKPNYHGYYDILSINFAEILFKGAIYTSYRLFFGLVPIAVINKFAVFTALPLTSSIGIWMLASAIVKRKSKYDQRMHFSIVLLANIFYTFSLLLIFDLHGGALNRQISSVIFPFFWTLLYKYYTADTNKELCYIPITAILFMFFDISNIFYFACISAIIIFFKPLQLYKKIVHYAILGVSAVFLHAFWLHAFFIGNQLTLGSIFYGRSPNYILLEPYSATFSQLILNIKTPHDLIEGIYRYSPFIAVPFVVMFGTILFAMRQQRMAEKQSHMVKLFMVCYFFSTTLTLGTHSILSIHQKLYETGVLAFVGGALRFAPNTLSALLVLFLFASNGYMSISQKKQHSVVLILNISIGILIFSYVFNGSIIHRILSVYPPANGVNNEVGALYDYPKEPQNTIQKEKLIYTILPLPSWYSPVYTDNVFPKTSQGSLVDAFYMNKTMLFTNTTPLFSSNYFHSAINYPNDLFLSYSNVGRINSTRETVLPGLREYSFSKQWLQDTGIAQKESNSAIYYTNRNFYPHIYSPDFVSVIDSPLELMYLAAKRVSDNTKTQATALLGQITKATQQKIDRQQWERADLEYKRVDTTSYYVVAHNVSKPFYLIVSDSYHPGWTASILAVKNHSKYRVSTKSVLNRYYSFPENHNTQASADLIAEYLQKGMLSSIPQNNSRLEYVSKQYHHSIQNDMLQFNTHNPVTEIDASEHFKVNGFANAWFIDVPDICAHAKSPCKNSQDIVIWVHFKPQIAYQYALLLSCICAVVLVAISYVCHKNKTNQHVQ